MIRQVAKSKTMNFNVFMPILLLLAPHVGIAMTPELSSAILALGNIVLRFLTNKPLKDK